MIIGGIEGTDANGKPINKIGVWTDKGFVETPIEKLFPPLKKKKQSCPIHSITLKKSNMKNWYTNKV